MKAARPIEQLSWHFDAEPLAAEVAQLSESDWIPYANSGMGNFAVPLIAVAGTPNHEYALSGPMQPTAILERLPGLKKRLAALGVPLSASRLVRLEARNERPMTADWSYHSFRRTSICIPIVTAPGVVFECGASSVGMGAGDAWLFDVSQRHRLRNSSAWPCVHLIVEIREPPMRLTDSAESIKIDPHHFEVLTYEEVVVLTDGIIEEVEGRSFSSAEKIALREVIERIRGRWKAAFERFGHNNTGELAYDDILLDLRERVLPHLSPMGAAKRAATVMDTMLRMAPPEPRKLYRPATNNMTKVTSLPRPKFDRPLIIVAAPRSGSTLLFDLLAQFPQVWTIGGESHACIRSIPELHPASKGYESDRLTADDATPAVVDSLLRNFTERLVNRETLQFVQVSRDEVPHQVRFVEKTPSNALRIPFLRAVFPDALFVYLERDPRENISSLVEGWRSRRFLAYRGMPDWPYRDWSFLLPPGWRSLADRSLVEIAAHQWHAATEAITKDLEALPASSWCHVNYANLVRQPREVLAMIAQLAGFDWDAQVERVVSAGLPLSRVTVSAPSSAKWRRNEKEITTILARFR